MKRLMLNLFLAFALVAVMGVTGCKKDEPTVDSVNDAADEAAEKVEDAADEAGDAVGDVLGE